MGTINLTKGGFERRVANIEQMKQKWEFLGQRPAVIDFYAPWCGPCKALSPVLDEVAEQYNERVDIYKVNVDEELELATLFGIRSVPTLLFVPMEGAPQRAMGAPSKEQLTKAIDEVLLGQ